MLNLEIIDITILVLIGLLICEMLYFVIIIFHNCVNKSVVAPLKKKDSIKEQALDNFANEPIEEQTEHDIEDLTEEVSEELSDIEEQTEHEIEDLTEKVSEELSEIDSEHMDTDLTDRPLDLEDWGSPTITNIDSDGKRKNWLDHSYKKTSET